MSSPLVTLHNATCGYGARDILTDVDLEIRAGEADREMIAALGIDIAFTTLADPKQMPGMRYRSINWPYREGLRIDEAMHPLTLLATGLYGKPLPQQNGAPLRLITPWKYGFKGIKSIVHIRLVRDQPPTTWNQSAPNEYGFYANVNPHVDHPRWSQATERFIGSGGILDVKRQPTLLFNGYADQVASLYRGMDLRENF